MEIFLKRSYKFLIKFDVYFRNIKVINYFLLEKVYELFLLYGIIYATV